MQKTLIFYIYSKIKIVVCGFCCNFVLDLQQWLIETYIIEQILHFLGNIYIYGNRN